MGSHFQRLLTTYDKGEIPVEPSGVSVGTFRVRIMNIAVDRVCSAVLYTAGTAF